MHDKYLYLIVRKYDVYVSSLKTLTSTKLHE